MPVVTDVSGISKTFPEQERSGLINEMRRAVVSIPINIAAGVAWQTPNEFIQYLHVAQGPLSQLDTQLVLANDLGGYRQRMRMGLRMP